MRLKIQKRQPYAIKNILSQEKVADLLQAVQGHAQAVAQAQGQGQADRLQVQDKEDLQARDNIAPRNGGFLLGVDKFI